MASLWATFTNQAWWLTSPAPPTLKQWALKQHTIIRFESEKSGWHVRRACGIWRLHLGHCQLWSSWLPAFLHLRGQFTDQKVEVSPTVKRWCSTSKSLMALNSARIQWPAWQEHPRGALPTSHGRLRLELFDKHSAVKAMNRWLSVTHKKRFQTSRGRHSPGFDSSVSPW